MDTYRRCSDIAATHQVHCPAKAIAFLICGNFLRVPAREAKTCNPQCLERFAHACKAEDEEIFRTLYDDCAPFSGTVKLPVSGTDHTFPSNDAWLRQLCRKDLFAARRRALKSRGVPGSSG
jgi:hypothetical protein